MIIAFALGLIGAILILANNKYLRKLKVSIAAFILSSGLAVTGIYFILNASRETDSRLFFPMFSPLTALILWLIARLLYKKYQDKEIILYLRGLFPIRHEERYVTKQEINITFIILVLSVLIPFMILSILL